MVPDEDSDSMQERFVVTCPYCGQDVEIYLEADIGGTFIQDCEVCCNPWSVRVENVDGARDITVVRADGSE